jgi:hypothetical protein
MVNTGAEVRSCSNKMAWPGDTGYHILYFRGIRVQQQFQATVKQCNYTYL